MNREGVDASPADPAFHSFFPLIKNLPKKSLSQGRIRARTGLRLTTFASARIISVQIRGYSVQGFCIRGGSFVSRRFRLICEAV
jgi:hypothetical protein